MENPVLYFESAIKKSERERERDNAVIDVGGFAFAIPALTLNQPQACCR